MYNGKDPGHVLPPSPYIDQNSLAEQHAASWANITEPQNAAANPPHCVKKHSPKDPLTSLAAQPGRHPTREEQNPRPEL